MKAAHSATRALSRRSLGLCLAGVSTTAFRGVTFQALGICTRCRGTPALGSTAPALLRPLVKPQPNFGVRFIAEGEKQEGLVKMWNDDRGFGFVTSPSGEEDLFVHRSAVMEGGALAPGQAVTFEAQWDDRRRKHRVSALWPKEGGGDATQEPSQENEAVPRYQAGGPTREATGATRGQDRKQSRMPQPEPKHQYIVAALENWAIHPKPMEADGEDSPLRRHRLVVRKNAPQAPGERNARREEFQIVGDKNWDLRLFPAGGFREEVIVVRPSQRGSRAVVDYGKGHGRNWAVEGPPGSTFDIIYDTETKMVSCESAFLVTE